jgi:hypothetical protein
MKEPYCTKYVFLDEAYFYVYRTVPNKVFASGIRKICTFTRKLHYAAKITVWAAISSHGLCLHGLMLVYIFRFVPLHDNYSICAKFKLGIISCTILYFAIHHILYEQTFKLNQQSLISAFTGAI